MMTNDKAATLILATVLCLAAVGSSWAQVPSTRSDALYIRNGFATGNEFQRWDQERKRGYLIGFVDSLFVSPLYGNTKVSTLPFERCIAAGMTDVQLVAIVDKWLASNPARWHEGAHVLTLLALKEACGMPRK
jgi:Rap1a immunity proteins